MAWISGEPGAAAWLLGAALAVAVRAALALARRRTRRMTWSGQWFEASTSWPPRRGVSAGQVPPHRNPPKSQSDIGCSAGVGKGGR